MISESSQQPVSVTWSAQAQDRAHTTARALLFVSGGATYGVSVEFVRRVVELPSVVPVAGSSAWFLGMANCEGSAVPLIDIQAVLKQSARPPKLNRAIIVDCAFGTVMLAVEQITTLADLSGKKRHPTVHGDYPAQYIEFSCEAAGVMTGVLSLASLFKVIGAPTPTPHYAQGEGA